MKFEYRISKSETNSNIKYLNSKRFGFSAFNLDIVSKFVLRASDFKKIYILLLVLLLILPQIALAANPCVNGPDANLAKCITQIYRWALGLSAILAMLMMVLGGYLVMTAGGSAQQSEKGKGYILSAIVGMGLLFGTYLILNTINPDLVQFRDLSKDPFKNELTPQQQQNPAAPRQP